MQDELHGYTVLRENICFLENIRSKEIRVHHHKGKALIFAILDVLGVILSSIDKTWDSLSQEKLATLDLKHRRCYIIESRGRNNNCGRSGTIVEATNFSLELKLCNYSLRHKGKKPKQHLR